MVNDCIQRNFESMHLIEDSRIHKMRYKILKKFIGRNEKTIDVGCGAYMPHVLKASHACDISKDSLKYLESLGWKGEFKKANVLKLPYKKKEFDIAICSEVIEHLKTKEEVRKAFREVDRISKSWLMTTPYAYDSDPDHNFHFGWGSDEIFDFIPVDMEFSVVTKGYYYFISNDENKLYLVTGVKDGKG